MYYDTKKLEVIMSANVKPNYWLGVGFGKDMGSSAKPEDMIVF
jgi:hypothetical protein